jgi:hypothetical protein
VSQILSVTCDNATNNDSMINELKDLLENFSGAENRTRCFAHIINLIAQTIIRQFDVPKTKVGESVDKAMLELQALATDIDVEEALTQAGNTKEEGDDEDDDDLEGWVDERSKLSTVDLTKLEGNVQPVRKALVKVCLERCQGHQTRC